MADLIKASIGFVTEGRLEVFPMLLLILPAAWRHSGDKGRHKEKIENEFN